MNKEYKLIMFILDYLALNKVKTIDKAQFFCVLDVLLEQMDGVTIADIADANDCDATNWGSFVSQLKELWKSGERI